MLIVRNLGELFYANVTRVHDTITTLVATTQPRPHLVVWDLEANDSMDTTTAAQIDKLVASLRASGVDVAFVSVHQPVVERARNSGHLALLGPDHLFPSVEAAVVWDAGRSARLPSSGSPSSESGS